MLRTRFLRMAVRWRRLKRQPKVAARLGRVRQVLPFAASTAFNVLLVAVLVLGYTSFVAKGVVNGGIGERVVTVQLFDRDPRAEQAQEVPVEDETEELEDAEVGIDAMPEGNAVEDGEQTGEPTGDEAPDAEVGQDIAVAKAGVDIPTIAVPEVDAGEGRPDGVVGVDCYGVFQSNSEKALECAGRDILSGWRAEVADLGEDWERFARALGSETRQIRYGPLLGRPQNGGLRSYDPALQVPPEVAKAYEQHLARLRREEQIREYGRVSEARQDNRARKERDQDAATYDPLSPDLPD
ncbi:MAG: hypothetical protein AAGH41_01050 [Pseudomonadota bacterium]